MTGGSWREELFLLSFLRVSRHQSACLYRFSMTLSEIALAAPRAPPSLPENRVSPRDARGSLDKTFTAIHKVINECGVPKETIRGRRFAELEWDIRELSIPRLESCCPFPGPGQMTEWKNVPLQHMLEQEFAMPCILEDSVRAIAFDLPPFFAHGIIRHFLHSGLRLRTAEPVKRSRPQPPSSL